MAEVIVRNIQKSDIQPKHDYPNGVDLRFGEPIIFEYKDETYLGYCQGWRFVGEKAMVKTDLFDGVGAVDVPVDKVWRVRDARDDRIAELDKLAGYWIDKYNDLLYDRDNYKTLYESLHKAYVEPPKE